MDGAMMLLLLLHHCYGVLVAAATAVIIVVVVVCPVTMLDPFARLCLLFSRASFQSPATLLLFFDQNLSQHTYPIYKCVILIITLLALLLPSPRLLLIR